MDVGRRRLLQTGQALLMLSVMRPAWAAAKVIAVRLWPSPDYSRLTLESASELQNRFSVQASPPRLIIDFDHLTLDGTLGAIKSKLHLDDPYIRDIAVSQPGTDKVRIVVALRQSVSVQTLKFKPIKPYQHRLVFDLRTVKEADPLAKLMEEIHRSGPSVGNLAALDATQGKVQPSVDTDGVDAQDPLSALLREKEQASAQGGKAVTADAASTLVSSVASAETTKAAAGKAATLASATAPALKSNNTATNHKAPAVGSAGMEGGAKITESSNGTQRVIIVALDPGHGGEDPGAIGPRGTREKDIVLHIAKRLQTLINNARQVQGNPMRAFMTRDADFFVPLSTRVRKAQQVQADLFISIHADAFSDPGARGASVFALSTSGASSAAASWIARQENRADDVGGVILTHADRQTQRFLLDLSTSAQVRDSLKLGSAVVGRLSKFAKMHKGSVEQAGFAVLKSPDIPSILVETAFISNPEEEQLLRSGDYQAQIADSILQGIRAYFAQNPPLSRTKKRA